MLHMSDVVFVFLFSLPHPITKNIKIIFYKKLCLVGGEGNGTPLQHSCLENPRDWGAWWAAVYGVTQSQRWLKQLSSMLGRRTDLWTWGEGEMYGKSNLETSITICNIDSQWEFALCLRELRQGLCVNLDGWDGEGGSKGRGHMYTYGWFVLRFDRKQQNSVKPLSFN